MKILAFTDFHGNLTACQKAREVIVSEKPDFVVAAGDITNYDLERAKQLLLELAKAGRRVYFVPGNMDNTELARWAGTENIRGLHGCCQYFENAALIGLGGSPHGPFSTPFEYHEEEAAKLLDEAMKGYHGGNLVFVSHCPPKDTKLDRVYSGMHAGSTSVRRFVERVQPLLVISGHIHEAQGIDQIGAAKLVNTGPAHRGNYAKITLSETVEVAFAKLLF